MSGNAGFTYLDPYFQFSYKENVRKVVDSEHYDQYWQKKSEGFSSVLGSSVPQMKKILKQMLDSKIPIVPLNMAPHGPEKIITTPEELIKLDPHQNIKILINEKSGKSTFVFYFNQVPTLDQAKRFFELIHLLEFQNLSQNASKNETGEMKAREKIQLGASKYKLYDKFSLAVITTAYISTDNLHATEKVLDAEMLRISKKIGTDFDQLASQNKVWIDPQSLVPLKVKFGSNLNAALTASLDKSVFNPYGPLFDDLGLRTIHRTELLTYSMLFVTKEKWKEDPKWSSQRAAFENWFSKSINGQ